MKKEKTQLESFMQENTFHEHDCPCCHYLGSKEYPQLKIREMDKIDFYVCEQNGKPTIIGRFGGGSDYFSSLSSIKLKADKIIERKEAKNFFEAFRFIAENPETSMASILGEAAKRAMEQGFLNENLQYTFDKAIKQEKKRFMPI